MGETIFCLRGNVRDGGDEFTARSQDHRPPGSRDFKRRSPHLRSGLGGAGSTSQIPHWALIPNRQGSQRQPSNGSLTNVALSTYTGSSCSTALTRFDFGSG